MSIFSRWFGRGGAIAEGKGTQNTSPSVALVPNTVDIGIDGAMQLSTVWACVDRRASTIASLPFFAYETLNGEKTLARKSGLGKWEAMAIVSRVRAIVKGSDSLQSVQTLEEALILERIQKLC